jgi:sulfoxide reductase heme-binding subunit YedZ
VLDKTAKIGLLDVVVPFYTSYGQLAIGLGTISFDLLVLVTVTALLRRHVQKDLWLWLHRLSYVAFALIFLHAVLSGTDFSDPTVSAITWGSAAALLTLGIVRTVGGRLPA